MKILDLYLLLGILVHIGLLVLIDWLGYYHVLQHGYDHTILALILLNIAIGFGLYYLVWQPLRRSMHLRRMVRTAQRKP